MARNLVDHKGYEPVDYSERIVDLFTSNRIVGRGLACDAAAGRLASGIGWEEAGCPPPSAGNGTAMRAAPVGMAYFDRPDLMIDTARKQGWVTHRDQRCDAGSIAIAGAVALAILGRIDPAEFCGQLADWMRVADADFAEMVRKLPDQLSVSPDQAVSEISVAGLSPGETPDWRGISPFVVPSVLWSLYCFLRTPEDCFESIWHSIACGGDVDTTAAMTGAISGAYLGVEALPQALLLRLHDGGTWRLGELSDLLDRLHESFPVSGHT